MALLEEFRSIVINRKTTGRGEVKHTLSHKHPKARRLFE